MDVIDEIPSRSACRHAQMMPVAGTACAGRGPGAHAITASRARTGSAARVSIITSHNATNAARDNQYNDAYQFVGDDEVYVANMGPHYRAMIETYGRDVLPAVREG